MKYPASDKLEIIRLVEESHLGVKRTLEKFGVSKSAFNRWYDLYARFGEQGLEDRHAGPGRVWNRIPTKYAAISSRWRRARPRPAAPGRCTQTADGARPPGDSDVHAPSWTGLGPNGAKVADSREKIMIQAFNKLNGSVI